MKNDVTAAAERLDYIFNRAAPWCLVDSMSILHVMEHSDNREVRERLLSAIRVPRKNTPIIGLRDTLNDMYRRLKESLKEE